MSRVDRLRARKGTLAYKWESLTLHERVMVLLCRAYAPRDALAQCHCFDGSGHQKRPACNALDGAVRCIIDEVTRENFRVYAEQAAARGKAP